MTRGPSDSLDATAETSAVTQARPDPQVGPEPKPPRRPSRVEQVIDHIKAQIEGGRLKPGGRLPNESQMAQEIGVSRTPVREAVKILDAAGIIETRHGAGTFVTDGPAASLAQLLLFRSYLSETTPQKLMEVRAIFERSCAELAAVRRTEEDLEALAAAIERLRGLGETATLDEICEADCDFHRLIYTATHNELISTLATLVLSIVKPWIRQSLEVAGRGNAIKLHEMLYAMIENGNVGGAREMTALDPVDHNMEHFRITLERPSATPRY